MSDESKTLQLHRKAIAAHEQDDPKAALRYLHEALDLDPLDPALHNTIGALYRAIGAYGPAISHFQEAIALNPTYEVPRNNLKRSLEIAGPEVQETLYDIRYRGQRLADSPKVLVIGHERSGLHFLINTLALNFGYISQWIDIRTDAIAGQPDPTPHLSSYKNRTLSNVLKSHHARPLFGETLEDFLTEFKIFYIVRDPRDAMTSFWRFAGTGDGDLGPRTDSVDAFVRSAPSGQPLLFEHPPSTDMIARWSQHVGGWLPDMDSGAVKLVKYEDLLGNYDETLDGIADHMATPPIHRLHPDPSLPGRTPWKSTSGIWRERMSVETESYIGGIAGNLMFRLGYF
ncbi:MAG: sulfotransferase domain-containing protein [Proteobacteria bacterium]|nr:sulfotransferase domain-containing protein [Pseudomonadota bacterium]